jgi:AmmeMemoRadiSam system protein B
MDSAVRLPAVAGLFYPREPERLAVEVDAHLAAGRRTLDSRGWEAATLPRALVAPHAGYVYSGAVAGTAFATLAAHARVVRRVVLIGPAHRVPVEGLALPGARAFATPLGEVEVDQALVGAVAGHPAVAVDPRAHAPEHALEVELPFLQRVLAGGFTVLPLVVGWAGGEQVADVLRRLGIGAGGGAGDDVLLLVSSDLSHYLPWAEANAVDRATVSTLLAGGRDLVPEQACGAYPLNGLRRVAEQAGWRGSLLDLRNSGDTAGDRSAVVGYAAVAYTAPPGADRG